MLAPESLSVRIRSHVAARTGKEKEAEDLLGELERRTVVYERAEEIELPSSSSKRSLMPKVAKLLGIGDSILPKKAPRWL